MTAKVFLEPCPLCVKGKRCKGHAGDALLIGDRRVDVFLHDREEAGEPVDESWPEVMKTLPPMEPWWRLRR